MKKSIFLSFGAIVIASFLLMSFVSFQQKQPEPWPVPAAEKSKANPVKADDASVKLGLAAYNKNCASCHGKTGLGDGPKGRSLKTFAGDFSSAAFQAQTDGEASSTKPKWAEAKCRHMTRRFLIPTSGTW